MDKYEPTWPDTVVFWGAGANAALGFKTTEKLGNFFVELCKSYQKGHIGEIFNKITHDCSTDKSLENLFKFLDSSIKIEDLHNEIKEEFGDDCVKRVNELRDYYDWNSLMRIMKICPNFENMQLQDLFNIIDMHIYEKEGFYVNDNKEEKFLPLQNIIKSRNMLVMMTNLIHSLNYREKNKRIRLSVIFFNYASLYNRLEKAPEILL
jgi:hypothetical protein